MADGMRHQRDTKEKEFLTWNPWHGCRKEYPGCDNCWMHVLAKRNGTDPNAIAKSSHNWNLPLAKISSGNYKIPPGTLLHTCLTSDFFLDDIPKQWRDHVWDVIRRRSDVGFALLTKRAHNIERFLPEDWIDSETGETNYKNVELAVTVENQEAVDRLRYLVSIPAARKRVMCEPLIGAVDITDYLASGEIDYVLCGGENYNAARICDERWVKSLSNQCRDANVPFRFFDTGENFKTIRGDMTQERDKAKRSDLARSMGYDVVCPTRRELSLHVHPADDMFFGDSLF